MLPKTPLYGMTLAQLQDVCLELGLQKFVAKQICNWLYNKHIRSIDEMTNISQANREKLSSLYVLGLSAPEGSQESSDGTKKYLYRTFEQKFIESAYIPDGDRATLCVSSQAGCRMGCRFCATATLGLFHSLSSCEILNQIESLPERDKLTNVVFMGMGEPLDNTDEVLKALEILTADWGFGWSPSRITLSTCAITKNIERFLQQTSVHLAVSLHNPFHDERMRIMPVEQAYPISEFLSVVRRYDFTHQRRISFEYILLEGMNDSPRHIKELCRLLNGIKCRINIIRFHKIPGSPYYSPSLERMTAFRDSLTQKGIMTTIRQSRGEDIKAACGLLSADRHYSE